MNRRVIIAGLLIAALGQFAPPLPDVVRMYRQDDDLFNYAALPYLFILVLLCYVFFDE